MLNLLLRLINMISGRKLPGQSTFAGAYVAFSACNFHLMDQGREVCLIDGFLGENEQVPRFHHTSAHAKENMLEV